ncbi:helix-turn-helix transcriptional regulator [Nocardia otitidiscaviarum]|nr:helix-turn-helix transcriptional regulator [Nocardia otitidiscaviarum]
MAILRDAFVDHVRRFSDWLDRTGAPPAILTSRLNALVDAGLMRRSPRSGGYDRNDYLLTDLGLATWELLVSIWTWQREWSAAGLLQPELVHAPCGHRGPPELVCRPCGRMVKARDVRVELDPAALVATGKGWRRSSRSTPPLSRADLQFTEVMEAIGDRWSALVTGLALSGVRRFGEFRSILEISPTTLADRLARLSEARMITRGEGDREYSMTPRGRALFPIFAFQLAWSQRAHPDVPPEQLGPCLYHDACGNQFAPALHCRGCDATLERTSVHFEA